MSAAAAVSKPTFVVATPGRSVCDNNARVLYQHGLLRFLALGTRRGIQGLPLEVTRLNPKIGLLAYAAARTFSTARAESLRFRLHPWFDRWVLSQLEPGNHIISSYGYANESFRWVRQHGGKTFLDGGNSHPDNFWSILVEEHKRWNCSSPPIARHHYQRSLRMMPEVDYVLSPSSFVSRSFLDRGFKAEQILPTVYPTDLTLFRPTSTPRPADRPLTIIAPGSLSLRKGTPYLLEGFRLVLKTHPTARLVLNRAVFENVAAVVSRHADLPIDWLPFLTPAQLGEKMRECDLMILPSLEDGFARTVLEALACGLPVITTPNTGASELIQPGKNGEVVPIRDPGAIADGVCKWAGRVMNSGWQPVSLVDTDKASMSYFQQQFMAQLIQLGLAGNT